MDLNKYIASIKRAYEYGVNKDLDGLVDAFEMCRELELHDSGIVSDGKAGSADIMIYNLECFNAAHEYAKKIRTEASKALISGGGSRMEELVKHCLLFDAPHDFDAYCRYIEWERPQEKQFYVPRRKQLLPIARDLQELEDDKLDLLAISCPPGIGKTTIAIFYLTWIGGRHPELPMLGGSHSNSFLRGVYDEILRIATPGGEYLFNDVFPHSPLSGTNAKDMRIDLESQKRFQTFEFSSIGSGNAGKVRAGSLLYCDDLVDGIETAMSKDRLDKLWQMYYTDLRQRKIGNCKELHIATRWSIWDVIGRLEQEFEGNKRAKFIRFAALNENDESNFDYPYGVGFSTEFYRQQREIMDEASWRALYMNEPIERFGVLYEESELRRYFSLPEREPDAIISVVDTKNKGDDYCVVPVAYKYGDDYYIDHFVCDNGKPEIVDAKVTKALVDYRVQSARFESNNAGGRIAENIEKSVKEQGGITQITTKWNQANKETRIVIASAWIKSHCLFKDKSLYQHDKEYRTAMSFLCGYTMAGKNKHDDVPDAMAAFYDYAISFEAQVVKVFTRLW